MRENLEKEFHFLHSGKIREFDKKCFKSGEIQENYGCAP